MPLLTRTLIALVKAYRFCLSPWLGSSCRFTPTCSAYSMQALETHGSAFGTYLTLRRIARCHRWCAGGVDEVPSAPAQAFALRLPDSPPGLPPTPIPRKPHP